MRAQPNALYTLYTSFALGPPVPFYTAPCRFVPWDQIQPAAPPPFFNIVGYITIDPPYNYVAGVTILTGFNAFTYDLHPSTPVEVSTSPGTLYFPILIDNVVTGTDAYARLWLVDVTFIP